MGKHRISARRQITLPPEIEQMLVAVAEREAAPFSVVLRQGAVGYWRDRHPDLFPPKKD